MRDLLALPVRVTCHRRVWHACVACEGRERPGARLELALAVAGAAVDLVALAPAGDARVAAGLAAVADPAAVGAAGTAVGLVALLAVGDAAVAARLAVGADLAAAGVGAAEEQRGGADHEQEGAHSF